MYSVRKLITDAFRASTVRGIGDTPDYEEVSDALVMLNDALDSLSGNESFSAGLVTHKIRSSSDGKIRISDNPNRVIASLVSNPAEEYILAKTRGGHGLSEADIGKNVKLRIGHNDFNTSIAAIVSASEIAFNKIESIAGAFSKCSFALENEEVIDIIDVPPVNIRYVRVDGRDLPEIQENVFYRCSPKFGGWFFYDKNRVGYPTLVLSNAGIAEITYQQPCWTDLTIDSNLEMMPRVVRQVLKYKLAADIAEANGYLDISDRLIARSRSALATFIRGQEQLQDPEPDISAPGYQRGSYNIYLDY